MNLTLNLIRISHWLDEESQHNLKDMTGFKETSRFIKNSKVKPFDSIFEYKNSYLETMEECLRHKNAQLINLIFHDKTLIDAKEVVDSIGKNHNCNLRDRDKKGDSKIFDQIVIIYSNDPKIEDLLAETVATSIPFVLVTDFEATKSEHLIRYIFSLAYDLRTEFTLYKAHQTAKDIVTKNTGKKITLLAHKELDLNKFFFM